MSVLILFFCVLIPQLCSSQSRGMILGDILWEIVVPNNPGTTIQDKQIRSIKQIPDLNGDNVNEVAVATGNYWTICLNGINGNELWKFSTHFGSINTGSVEWEEAMTIADVNNDGIYDVVIGCAGGNEMVYALNGLNGSRLWSYGDSIITNDGDIEAISIRYDFNGDGIKDPLVSTSGVTNGGRHALICLNAVNGQEIFYRVQPEPFTDDVVATESGGAIGVNNNGAPYTVRGFNASGNTTWNYNAPGNTWSLKEIPDVSSDGIKDIVGLCGFTGAVFAITGNAGTQVWSQSLGSSNNGKITLLDDADGNGFIDISLSAPQVAYRLDSKTGNILWSNPLSSSYLRGIDNISDVTGDTIDDLVVATQVPARLLVLNGINGNILFEHFFGSTLNQRGDRAAVLNDIDTNGVNEFLGGNREGKVICFYGGNGTITSVNSGTEMPHKFALHQNYPNPFNPVTVISYQLAVNSFVKLIIYDALGKEVATLVNEKKSVEGRPRTYHVEFDARQVSRQGSGLASGVYFYRLEVEDLSTSSGQAFVETKRMILIK
ncbi:MAG: hypothetical protein HGGPFJEG_00490 [Ignavibacteria bacterium]|nr:hypothetical protein [Ignavibacteria bacterium]